MSFSPYEEIEHTADWAIIVRGATLPELFENAAKGMFSLLDAKVVEEDQLQEKILDLSAIDPESLLVTWLEELLFLLDTEQLASGDFEVRITANELHASFKLYPIRSMKKEIKAVTYNELEIIETDGGFRTTIVFDV